MTGHTAGTKRGHCSFWKKRKRKKTFSLASCRSWEWVQVQPMCHWKSWLDLYSFPCVRLITKFQRFLAEWIPNRRQESCMKCAKIAENCRKHGAFAEADGYPSRSMFGSWLDVYSSVWVKFTASSQINPVQVRWQAKKKESWIWKLEHWNQKHKCGR